MKKNYIFLISLIGFLGFFSFAFSADADIFLPNPLGAVGDFASLILLIFNWLKGIIGTLAVLMFVIAGIQFVVSAGNPGKIDQAKKTAIYAAIGAGVALAGGALIELVKSIIGVP